MSFLDKMFSGAALALRTVTENVDVSESTEPAPGDVLTALDATHAHWLPPPTGGGGGSVDAVARAAAAAAQSTADSAASAAAAAQSTADVAYGVAISASGDAAAAQSTANTAVTNAAAAQSTANTAVTNAAAAQSTANTAVTNAAAAQSTANTAVTNAAAAQSTANAAVPSALYDPNTILAATADNTPVALTVAPSTLVGRKATGGIVAATAAEVAAIINGQNLGDSASIAKSLMGAESVLAAVASGTPISLSVPASTFVGRKATGDVTAMTVSEVLALLGVSGSFSIASDINPLHWYRGDNIASTAGLVDTILDAGSLAKNFTQTGTPRCPTGTDANGKIYLAPDGSADFYTAGVAADWKFLNDGSPWTIAVVLHRPTLLAVGNEMFLDTTDGTTASTGAFVVLTYTSSTRQGLEAAITLSSASVFAQVTYAAIPNTSLQLMVVRHVGQNYNASATAVSAPIDMQMRRNGVLVSTCGSSSSSTVYANTNPLSPLTLFRRSVTAGQFCAARLYDLIVDNKAWSDRQTLGYENYARTQYGVAI